MRRFASELIIYLTKINAMLYHSIPTELLSQSCEKQPVISSFQVSKDIVALKLPNGQNVQYEIISATEDTIYCKNQIEIWINKKRLPFLDVWKIISQRRFSFLFKTIQGVEVSVIYNPKGIQF